MNSVYNEPKAQSGKQHNQAITINLGKQVVTAKQNITTLYNRNSFGSDLSLI